MDIAIHQVEANARKVITLQIIIAIVVALVTGLTVGRWFGISAFFGGFVSLSVSWLLRRGVLKANKIAKEDPKKGMIALYVGAVQRFVLVLALLGIGFGVFKLDPLAIIIGFGLAQVAYAVMLRWTAHPAKRT